MKLLTTIAGAVIIINSAAASLPVGRGELTFDASVAGTYDSNVSGSRQGQEDFYGTLTPRVSYIRKAGKIEADASLALTSQRYYDETKFNSDDISASTTFNLSEHSFQNISGTFTAAYVESYDVNRDVNARLKSNTTTFSGNGELTTGVRTSVSAQGSYSNSQSTGASDQKLFSGGTGFHYKGFLDDTTLNLTYNYTESKSSGDNLLGAKIDQNSHEFSAGLSRRFYQKFDGHVSYGYRILNRSAAETAAGVKRQTGAVFSAGIDGPFLPERYFPRLKSHISLEYENATTPGVNDPGSKQLTGSLSLKWDIKEGITSADFTATRSQRLAVTDLTAVSSTVRAGLQQKLRYNLNGTAGVGYDWEDYHGVDRKDELVTFDSGLSYEFARVWSAGATYRYELANSNVRLSDYTRHVVSLNLHYKF